MADPRHELGTLAEGAAARWLESAGWRLLARRYRSAAGGEVDLVMLDGSSVLVGVEVRARRSTRTGAPIETVDARRAARIARSLVAFAMEAQLAHRGLRVDVVAAVVERADGQRRLRLSRVANVGA